MSEPALFQQWRLPGDPLELAAGCLGLLTGLGPQPKLLLIAWLSTNFVICRAGLWLMNWHRPCNCLGTLTDFLHLSPTAADWLMKAALGYMLLGSAALMCSALPIAWLPQRKD